MATTKATLLGHRSATSFSDLTLSGDLTVNGTTTTLDTAVQNVDKLEIGASSTDYGAKINQASTGNILQLQDGGTDVMVVADGGSTTFSLEDGVTNAVTTVATLRHTSSGTTANGFGTGLRFEGEQPNGGTNIPMASINTVWSNGSAEESDLRFQTGDGGVLSDVMTLTKAGKVGIGISSSITDALHVKTTAVETRISLESSTGKWAIGAEDGDKFGILNYGTSTPFVVTSTGNVGIGTTSPDTATGFDSPCFEVAGSDPSIVLSKTGADSIAIVNHSSYLKFLNDTDDRAFFQLHQDAPANSFVMDSNGKVAIGTTSTDATIITGKTSGSDNCNIYLGATGTGNAEIVLDGSNGDFSGSDYYILRQTNALDVENWLGTSGDFIWSTAAGTERMRITSAGDAAIGVDSPSARLHVRKAVNGRQLQVDGGSSGTPQFSGGSSTGHGEIQIGATSSYHGTIAYADSGYTEMYIHNNYSGNTNARVTIRSGSSNGVTLLRDATSWSSSSDERMKDIHSHITGGLEKLSNVRTVIASFKRSPEKVEPMLIAQDFIDILPEAVSQNPPTEHDDDGTPEDGAFTLSYTSTIPLLVNAIQELSAKVTALENA